MSKLSYSTLHGINEHGTDRYGAEFKRTPNDFRLRYLTQDNCVCGICHGTGAKWEFAYVTRNYRNPRTKRICKTLQAEAHSFWICPRCLENLNALTGLEIEASSPEIGGEIMSKLDILAEGREQGILLARRLVEAAQKEGRDPLEAIDDELGYRKRYKQQSRFTKKEISEAYESYREETTVTLMSIACIVLWDVFKFGGKHRLPRFLAECDVYTKALAEGSITWKDIDNILVDKCGLNFIPEVLRR